MQIDAISLLLPGLLPGMYRGIGFHVPDTSSESGRRVVEYLFPGVDAAAYDDFGRAPGLVYISGLIIGDDYRAKGMALEAAFNTPGPGTLIHPWLGPMTVIMEEPGQIYFSDRELRVLRFTAAFKRMTSGGGISGFSSSLGSAISTMVTVASLLSAVVGTRVISSSRGQAVTRSTRVVTEAIGSLTAPADSRRFLPRLKNAIAASAPSTPVALDGLVRSTAALFADVAETPAVSPAAEATIEPAPSPQSLMSMGADLGQILIEASRDAPADADRALLVSAAAHYLAQGSVQLSYAEFTSRQEALSYRRRMTDRLDALGDALDVLVAVTYDAETSAMRRATRALQAAIIAEVNEVVGRLPSVVTFRPERPLDAWMLAQHVFGDTPERIEAGYADIIARNRPRHPSQLPDGDIEVLR